MAGITCHTKYVGGTYTTNTVKGKRATCTASPEEAVQRLARKIWPQAEVDIVRLADDEWSLEPPTCTHCEGSGEIEYPNISGHDYSESCKKCGGSGYVS